MPCRAQDGEISVISHRARNGTTFPYRPSCRPAHSPLPSWCVYSQDPGDIPMPLPGDGLETLEDMIVRAAETTAAHIRSAKAAISAVIFGQERVVERALVTVLSGGHALLVGVPGLAKTKLVETMGTVLGLESRRIQFTPDLMPSDILGSEVLEESPGAKRTFRFIRGPIFAQLLMADEINRASPRTQSALLQAMQE